MSACRRLLSFMTVAAFVAHVLWGCCWHDPRAGAHRESAVCSASPKPVHGCDHHDGPKDRCPPTDGPCKLHCRGVCIYVPPQKCQVDAPQINLGLDFAMMVVLQTDHHSLAAAEIRGGADDLREADSPPRLHLLHQIFVI